MSRRTRRTLDLALSTAAGITLGAGLLILALYTLGTIWIPR